MASPAQSETTMIPAPGSSLAGWLLLFIACGCMFVLGIMVGRNTAPVNFEMENLDVKLGQLQSSVLTETDDTAGQIETESINDMPVEDMPFEFYDKLKEPNTGETKHEDGSTSGEAPLKAPKYQKEDQVPAAVTVAELNRKAVAEEQRAGPVAPRETSRSGESRTHEIAAVSGYVIQVASLRDSERAETVRVKFRNKGYPAYTRQAVVEGKGQWWRVRIGPYGSKAQARNDLVRLQKAGVDAIILLVTDEND